jgi:hypothetical protein
MPMANVPISRRAKARRSVAFTESRARRCDPAVPAGCPDLGAAASCRGTNPMVPLVPETAFIVSSPLLWPRAAGRIAPACALILRVYGSGILFFSTAPSVSTRTRRDARFVGARPCGFIHGQKRAAGPGLHSSHRFVARMRRSGPQLPDDSGYLFSGGFHVLVTHTSANQTAGRVGTRWANLRSRCASRCEGRSTAR